MQDLQFWKSTDFSGWSLFLDRDGVINRRLVDDYVKSSEEWIWNDGVIDALRFFTDVFKHIFIVSNQQGVGKGIMGQPDLDKLTDYFLERLEKEGVEINGVYYCTELAGDPGNCRKPAPDLALLAKKEFPDVRFKQSVMVGDMPSDIYFGNNLGMKTVQILGSNDKLPQADYHCNGLSVMMTWIRKAF